MGLVWIIDDDQEICSLLEDFVQQLGHTSRVFALATHALESFVNGSELGPDVVLTDLNMPEMTGLEFLVAVKERERTLPVILLTAHGSIESAVEATQKGAFDYLTKPFRLAEVALRLRKALEYSQIARENVSLRRQIKESSTYGRMIGKGPAMNKVFGLIDRVAPSTASVLIFGESGTGKELVARALHQRSLRSKGPMVSINCSAIPATLLESELFGHAKGAFTGAVQKKVGLFEEANNGTLFLDEIGDLDLALQAKILRAIQERRIRPVGENKDRSIDVRIICATHKDLPKAIKEGLFREDLYYRLSVVPINLPPLRDRREDIPLLVQFFLDKYVSASQCNVKGFSKSAMLKLIHAPWEGNVRELENFIERMVVLADTEIIEEENLYQLKSEELDEFWGQLLDAPPSLEELERKYILFVLRKVGGAKEKAAEILGINRRTLYRKLNLTNESLITDV